MFLGDDTRALTLFARAAARSRADGAVDRLPMVLAPMASLQAWCGQYASAMANATDGLQLARDTGQENPAAHLRSVLAWVAAVQGREQDCRGTAAAALERAIGHRLGPQAAIASWALAVLDLGTGRPAEAFDRLTALAGASPGEGHQVVKIFSAADLVEAAVRTGQPDEAATAAAMLRGWANHVQAPWALALVARSDGLLDPAGDHQLFARGDIDAAVGSHRAAVGRVPATAAQSDPGPHAPAVSIRDVRPARCGAVGRAGAHRAAGHRGDGTQT